MTLDSQPAPAGGAFESDADSSAERAYLYGIVAAGSDLRGLTGLDGRSVLELAEAGEVAAVYSALPEAFDPSADLSEQDLATLVTRHDEVLRAIATRTTVLPVRFGAATRNPARLAAALAGSAAQLAEQLSAVAGCSEWGIQVERTEPRPATSAAAAPASSGIEYLRSRKAELADGAQVRRQLIDVSDALVTDIGGAGGFTSVGLPTDNRRLVNASYLVPDGRVDEFRNRAAHHEAEIARLGGSLRITGPWIAYSFTSIELAGVADD